MGKHLHKLFSTKEVKEVFERYLFREIGWEHALALLKIRSRQFFKLLKAYREDPAQTAFLRIIKGKCLLGRWMPRRRPVLSGSSRRKPRLSKTRAIRLRTTTTAMFVRFWRPWRPSVPKPSLKGWGCYKRRAEWAAAGSVRAEIAAQSIRSDEEFSIWFSEKNQNNRKKWPQRISLTIHLISWYFSWNFRLICLTLGLVANADWFSFNEILKGRMVAEGKVLVPIEVIQRRIQKEAEELFRAKQRRRQELAKLPLESKIFILCRLQKLAEDIWGTVGGTKRRTWDIRK